MERLKTRKSNGTQREAIGWSALLNRTRIAAIGEPGSQPSANPNRSKHGPMGGTLCIRPPPDGPLPSAHDESGRFW
jgi:hypothetical protein